VVHWVENWCSSPDKSLMHLAMRDPCFYECFVADCHGYINVNIQKNLHLVNDIPVKYHSLKFDNETQDWLLLQLQHSSPGDVITAPTRPNAVNVQLTLDPDKTPKEIVEALRDQFSLDDPGSESQTVVIPILPNTSSKWDDSQTPVYASHLFGPSKVTLGAWLPLEPAFAITVHKSEGETMDWVIVALSRCEVERCNFSHEQVHVAFSRVTQGNHIRFLLTGDTAIDQWLSISYMYDLRQDPSVKCYFCGFRDATATEDPNEGWLENAWSADWANTEFVRLIRENKL